MNYVHIYIYITNRQVVFGQIFHWQCFHWHVFDPRIIHRWSIFLLQLNRQMFCRTHFLQDWYYFVIANDFEKESVYETLYFRFNWLECLYESPLLIMNRSRLARVILYVSSFDQYMQRTNVYKYLDALVHILGYLKIFVMISRKRWTIEYERSWLLVCSNKWLRTHCLSIPNASNYVWSSMQSHIHSLRH